MAGAALSLTQARPSSRRPPSTVAISAPSALRSVASSARAPARALDVPGLEPREQDPVAQLEERPADLLERLGLDEDDGPAAGDRRVGARRAAAPLGRGRQQERLERGALLGERDPHGG